MILRSNGMYFIPVSSILRRIRVGEWDVKLWKKPERRRRVVVVSTLGDTRRWKVAVDGSERVQRGAGGKYGMKVANVLECRESIEGLRERTGWCRKAEMVHLGAALVREGERFRRMRIGRTQSSALKGTSTGGWARRRERRLLTV
ncbi:hypothetical protein M405DRAFT_831642 [Rhizopogon salebrosus TDB-379]|nr:hypothetical protein M405DRAFT_831642 [Rhizopogon salebrosus TDB-379]